MRIRLEKLTPLILLLSALCQFALPLDAGAESETDTAALFSSVSTGKIEQLKSFLASGGDANAVDANGRSLLFTAVQLNQVQAVELLLNSGALGINRLYDFGSPRKELKQHMLTYAVWGDEQEMVSVLLKHGADPSALDLDGREAIAGAIANGNVDILKILLDAGADPNHRWAPGYSAVSLAAIHGRTDILEMLLDHKGNVDFRDDYGTTPLIFAAQLGRVEAVGLLLERGALVHPLDAWMRPALGYASRLKDSDARERISSALIKAGAKEDSSVRPIDQAFLKACYEGNIQKASELLAKGADMYARGQFDGQLLLEDALSASVRHPKMVQFLLKKGINPFIRSSYDFTALHSAAAAGTPEVIEMLVASGLDPNGRAKYGQVPLFMAINGNPKPKNVAALLKLGANPNNSGFPADKSLLQIAKARNMKTIVEQLTAAGAK